MTGREAHDIRPDGGVMAETPGLESGFRLEKPLAARPGRPNSLSQRGKILRTMVFGSALMMVWSGMASGITGSITMKMNSHAAKTMSTAPEASGVMPKEDPRSSTGSETRRFPSISRSANGAGRTIGAGTFTSCCSRIYEDVPYKLHNPLRNIWEKYSS